MTSFKKSTMVGGGVAAVTMGVFAASAPPASAAIVWSAHPVAQFPCHDDGVSGNYQFGLAIWDVDSGPDADTLTLDHNCPTHNVAFRMKVKYQDASGMHFKTPANVTPINPFPSKAQMYFGPNNRQINGVCYGIKQNNHWEIRFMGKGGGDFSATVGCPSNTMGDFFQDANY